MRKLSRAVACFLLFAPAVPALPATGSADDVQTIAPPHLVAGDKDKAPLGPEFVQVKEFGDLPRGPGGPNAGDLLRPFTDAAKRLADVFDGLPDKFGREFRPFETGRDQGRVEGAIAVGILAVILFLAFFWRNVPERK